MSLQFVQIMTITNFYTWRVKTVLSMFEPLEITKFPRSSYFWNDFGTIYPLWRTKTAINFRDHILLRPIWTERETKVITLSNFFIKIGPYQWFSVLMGQMSAIRNMTKLQFSSCRSCFSEIQHNKSDEYFSCSCKPNLRPRSGTVSSWKWISLKSSAYVKTA